MTADPTASTLTRPSFTGYPLDVVKIDAYAPEDPRILDAGWRAELAYYTSLAWCRKHGTYDMSPQDAFACVQQTSPATKRRTANTLTSVGLWTTTPTGWSIPITSLFLPWPTRRDSVTEAQHRRRRSWLSHHKRAELLERDGHQCPCGATDDLTIDHIHPISMGGTDDMDNLRILCRRCNSSKKDRGL